MFDLTPIFLQPTGSAGEGSVSIASWTELGNGLRSPNYQFGGRTPATFSARIAPRLVGIGLLEAIPETAILAQIEEAILWHGGEGQASADAYRALGEQNQALLLRFLESL